MILYHRSKHLWDWPDYDQIQKMAVGWGPELGLYTCNVPDLYTTYGNYLYEIKLHEGIRPRSITLTEIRSIRDLSVYREVMLDKGWKVLQLLESNGEPTIYIIMDMSAVAEVKRTSK